MGPHPMRPAFHRSWTVQNPSVQIYRCASLHRFVSPNSRAWFWLWPAFGENNAGRKRITVRNLPWAR